MANNSQEPSRLIGYLYNNGAGAYYTHVIVATSTDNVSWTQIYSQNWDPSSTNLPSWVQIGSVPNIRYVKITAIDDQGYSANLF